MSYSLLHLLQKVLSSVGKSIQTDRSLQTKPVHDELIRKYNQKAQDTSLSHYYTQMKPPKVKRRCVREGMDQLIKQFEKCHISMQKIISFCNKLPCPSLY